MATRQLQKRLAKEYKLLQASPTPYIDAKPNEENILEWHYIITGPPETPFENGQYHGILRFPTDYPFKPPLILMITPNGRFQCNTRLCLSISDYHPDTWNPAWSVLTILVGLLSFMTGDENTAGSVTTSDAVKKRLARESKNWNCTENTRFKKQFPQITVSNKKDVEIQRQAEEVEKKAREERELAEKAQEDTVDFSQLDPEERARVMERDAHVSEKSYKKAVFAASVAFALVAIMTFATLRT